MTEEKNERIPDRKLVTAVGGLIAFIKYECPTCGAIEVKEIETGNPEYQRGGDGWCDNCRRVMKIIDRWY